MEERPGFLVHGRVVSLEAQIEAQQEISEVHAQTQAVGRSQLLVELVKLEHAPRLILIVADCPDISRIHKQCSLKHPEKLGSIFHIHIQQDIAALIDEVSHRILRVVRPGAQGAHAPSPDPIGATRVKTLFKRHHRRVEVRDGYAPAHMKSHGIARVEIDRISVIGLGLDILRIRDAQDLIRAIALMLPYYLGDGI